jgi:hypothetical protein
LREYRIDRDSDRVRNSVQHIVEQIAEAWQFKHEDRQMLIWAATCMKLGYRSIIQGLIVTAHTSWQHASAWI